MSRLTIKLFGPPQIELDGIALDLDHRKPVALLAYLAVTGQMHTRDALAALFWPDYGNARTYLRNNLWIIRKALGAWAETWLDIEHDLVGFKADVPLWVDVAEFQRRLAPCATPAHPVHAVCPTCLAHLSAAIALAQADFLAGFTLRDSPAFDEWQFFQGERIRQQLASVLEKLVQYYADQQDWPTAIQHAQRWLALDPLHELVHRQLMRLYAWAGQPAAALRQYQTCVQSLRKELQTRPDAETEALYQTIKTKQSPMLPSIVQPVAVVQAREIAPVTQMPVTSSPRSLPPLPRRAVTLQEPIPNNLLEQLTPLVGREQERVQLQSFLRRGDVRLVTLTGPGGVGKTRLAMQIAADLLNDFADGAYFVQLAPLREASLLPSAIAQTLGVRETRGQPLLTTLKSELRQRQMLLILDNYEHLVTAAPLVTDLLAACPRLKIVVTSREVLHLRGEQEFSVPVLRTPAVQHTTPLATLSQYEAVQLFIQRAQAVMPSFTVDNANAPAVAEICARLDGLPLAIELAAARIKFFSPQALLRKLTLSTLEVLRGGARDLPDRHQTLRRTIAWSYDLLNQAERTLFQNLAVFVGGFTAEAATAISAPDEREAVVLERLLSLVDKSLVQRESGSDGESRFLLLETVREFALECLKARGEDPVVEQRHAAYFLAFVETIEPVLFSADNIAALDQLELELDNLRALFRWVNKQQAVEIGLQLIGSLYNFWYSRGYFEEGRTRIAQVLVLAQGSPPSLAYAKALFSAGYIDQALGYYRAAQHFYEQSLVMGRQLGDASRVSYAAALLGNIHFDLGNFALADHYLAEGLRHVSTAQTPFHRGMILANMADHAGLLGNFAEAERLFAEALAELRRVGQPWALGVAYYLLGKILYYQGEQARAGKMLQESRALSQTVSARNIFYAESGRFLGLLAFEQGDLVQAHQQLLETLTILHELGYRRDIAYSFEAFAQLALQQEQPERALQLTGAAFALRKSMELVLPPIEQKRFDQFCIAARYCLSNAAATKAWVAGEGMTLDEAVNYALAM